jgi:hypothetical protein
MNYEQTILKLKAEGLIKDSDKYVFGRYDQKVSWGMMFGALGGLISVQWSNVDYLIAVNNETISVFAVDKKTGDYVNQNKIITRDKVNKLLCKKYLMGNRRIILRSKTEKFNMNFFTCNTFRGFEQTQAKEDFTEFVNTVWAK